MDTYLKYIGNGSAIVGVPARDLTKDEAVLHGEAMLVGSGLYKLIEVKQIAKKSFKKENEKELDND